MVQVACSIYIYLFAQDVKAALQLDTALGTKDITCCLSMKPADTGFAQHSVGQQAGERQSKLGTYHINKFIAL